jgi:hypothetical protein
MKNNYSIIIHKIISPNVFLLNFYEVQFFLKNILKSEVICVIILIKNVTV